MSLPASEQFRDLVSHAKWDDAAALLQQFSLPIAAENLLTLG